MYLPLIKSTSDLLSLLRYLAIVITDGDYLNDWLTHLPSDVAPHVMEVGKFIATLIG